MKKIRAKSKIDIVRQLQAVIDQRKEIEKKEKELKALVKDMMCDETGLIADDLLVIRSLKSRSGINKKKLVTILSDEQMEEVTKITTYETLEIKAA